MGRAKLPMKYIEKDKARTATFEKRKNSLKKKAYELATLCDVPVCVVIYQNTNSEPETFPSNQAEVQTVIDRYMSILEKENAKRSLGPQESVRGKKRKPDHQPSSHLQKKASVHGSNYPTWFSDLDGLSREQLANLSSDLDCKLNAVDERMRNLRGSFGIYNGNCNAVTPVTGCDGMQMQWPMCGGGFDVPAGGSCSCDGGMGSGLYFGGGGFDPAAGGSCSCEGGMGSGLYSGGGGFDLAADGSCSCGCSVGFSYDPNEFMGSDLYDGQVGPSDWFGGVGLDLPAGGSSSGGGQVSQVAPSHETSVLSDGSVEDMIRELMWSDDES